MRIYKTSPQIRPPVGREDRDISFEVIIPASCATYLRAAAGIYGVSAVSFISAWVVQEFWSEIEETCRSMGVDVGPCADEWRLGFEALDELSKVEAMPSPSVTS